MKRNPAGRSPGDRILSLVIGGMLVAAACLLLYPALGRAWNHLHASRAIAACVRATQETPREDLDRMRRAAQVYNEALARDPGRWDLDEAERARYEALLDAAGNGVMGTVEIPSIRVKLPVYHGTRDSVLQVGAGHMEGSSLPVGGPGTHAVITGHRGLPAARLFTDLPKVQVGDTFSLHVLGQVLTYRVDDIRTVLPTQLEDLEILPGQDLCTLVTCTPYGVNSHRLLVRGTRVLGEAGTEAPAPSDDESPGAAQA